MARADSLFFILKSLPIINNDIIKCGQKKYITLKVNN